MTTYDGNAVAYGSAANYKVRATVTDNSAGTVSWAVYAVISHTMSDSDNDCSWTIGSASGNANDHVYSGSPGTVLLGSGTFSATPGSTIPVQASLGRLASGTGPSVINTTYTLGMPPVYVKVAGTWRAAVAYVKVSGVWKQATVYKKVSGVWKA